MLWLQNLILHLGQLGLDVPLQLRGFFWEHLPQLSSVGVETAGSLFWSLQHLVCEVVSSQLMVGLTVSSDSPDIN